MRADRHRLLDALDQIEVIRRFSERGREAFFGDVLLRSALLHHAARRLRVSRSELYARAIAEFLKRQHGNTITERLNDLYSPHPARVDSALHRAQLKSLEKDAW